jgi:hypothetical protein
LGQDLKAQDATKDPVESKKEEANKDGPADLVEAIETKPMKRDIAQPRIHPLAVASARLQSNGISELSKSINLAGLVSSDEYFTLSNIVNPLLDVKTTITPEDKTEANDGVSNGDVTDLSLRALFLGKRKRAQFEWASKALKRHEARLAAAVSAQQVIDRRLKELRPYWRLVAPEHGIRARPHAARPTEVVAIDVEVYDRDRTGGGSMALQNESKLQGKTLGRLARQVPRYAIVELPIDYKIRKDTEEWKTHQDLEDAYMPKETDSREKADEAVYKTRAEPFSVADPTLGKIDVDFDPDKVPMLSLQLDIEKGSSGFRQSERLSPLITLGENAHPDERVVVALQHSLFCASLFESIRQELIPEEEARDVAAAAAKPTIAKRQTGNQVWLSSVMEENYLPPCSLMAGGNSGRLSVVHCHEGEVKVQLNSEYSLTLKLVEAGTAVGGTSGAVDVAAKESRDTDRVIGNTGSQNSQQLRVLCRALLLHAQNVFHEHSVRIRELLSQKARQSAETKPLGLEKRSKTDEFPQAHILQKCVSLGARMILERKIRWALTRLQKWLGSQTGEIKMTIEWLPLTVFDTCSQFVLGVQSFVIDVKIERDALIVTRFGDKGEYRRATFGTEEEFESFLKLELQSRLREINGNRAKS